MCNAPVESSLAGRLKVVVQRLTVIVALGTLAACGDGGAAPGNTQAPGDAASDPSHDPQKPGAGERCDPAASRCGSRFCTDGVCCDTTSCPVGQRCDILGSQGVCSATLQNGGLCVLDGHCQSGFCVDSACCAVAACADGQSCNVAGHPGECSALPTPPPPTTTGTPTATRTQRPTATPTATPPTAALHLSSAAGEPGERVTIEVSLDDDGAVVVGLQNDLVVDGINISIAARDNGRPDCSVEPTIHKDATAFGFVPAGCAGAACTGIRAIVLAVDNLDPIADGSVLYRCNVDIAAGAPSAVYPVALAHVMMSDPRGQAVRVAGGIDGEVSVGQVTPGTAAVVLITG